MNENSTNGRSRTKALFELSLDTSNVILSTLRDIGRIAPVPHLTEAAQLALGILSIIQAIKDCEEGFQRLARDSCGLVYAIYCMNSDGAGISEGFSRHLDQLVKELKSIEDFAKKRLKSKGILKLIQSNTDRGKILEYREVIRQSLDVFSVQSCVSGHQSMSRIERRQEEIALQQSTRDSENRLLLEEIRRKIYSKEPPATSTSYLVQPPAQFLAQPPERLPANSFAQASPRLTSQSEITSKNPYIRYLHPPHANAPRRSSNSWSVPSVNTPQYHIAGDYISEDKSQHIKNTNSNNTTTTCTVSSNNNSSTTIFG